MVGRAGLRVPGFLVGLIGAAALLMVADPAFAGWPPDAVDRVLNTKVESAVEEVALPAAAVGAGGVVAFFAQALQYGFMRLLGLLGLTKTAYVDIGPEDVRKRIQVALETSPGLSLSELRRAVDCNLAAVVGQLELMQRDGTVHSLLNAGRKRFFPAGFVDWARRDQVAALRHTGSRELLVALHQGGPMTAARLAEGIGVKAQRAETLTEQLEHAGLVERQGDVWRLAAPLRVDA